jgi:hypothetical protein
MAVQCTEIAQRRSPSKGVKRKLEARLGGKEKEKKMQRDEKAFLVQKLLAERSHKMIMISWGHAARRKTSHVQVMFCGVTREA